MKPPVSSSRPARRPAPRPRVPFFQAVEVRRSARHWLRFRSEVLAPPPPFFAADMVAAAMSSSGKFAGGVRFAGYGITAPEVRLGRSCNGVELKGQIALGCRVPADKVQGRAARSYSDPRYKAWNLREHGAQAVVFVDPRADALPKLTLDGPEGGAGLPVAFISRKRRRWLWPGPPPRPEMLGAAASAGNPGAVAAGDDFACTAGQSRGCRQGRGGRAYRQAERQHQPGAGSRGRERNVIGLRRAFAPAGAHAGTAAAGDCAGSDYDHLGLGDAPRWRRAERGPSGADDNASGTAALRGRPPAGGRCPRAAPIFTLPPSPGKSLAWSAPAAIRRLRCFRAGARSAQALSKRWPQGDAQLRHGGRLAANAGAGQAGGTQPTALVQGSDLAVEWTELVTLRCQRAAP